MTATGTAPTTLDALASALGDGGAELRAAGTDTTARQRIGRAEGPFVDLRAVTALRGVTARPDGSLLLGATTTVAELAAHPGLRASYSALAATARELATPQIRAVATLGGNLLQRNRCWYYRTPGLSCHQSGGDSCPAAEHAQRSPAAVRHGTVLGSGPCVAPHPSSLAVALLAHGAGVLVHGRGELPLAELYGDGADPTRDHLLAPGEVLTAVLLPAPGVGERSAQHRTAIRSESDWPLVEAAVRITLTDGLVTAASVAVGGVARTPLRLPEVEQALLGSAPTPEHLAAAAERAGADRAVLPGQEFKLGLLRDTVLQALENTVGEGPEY